MLVYKTVIQLLLLYKASLTKVRFYGFGFYFYSTLLEGRYRMFLQDYFKSFYEETHPKGNKKKCLKTFL